MTGLEGFHFRLDRLVAARRVNGRDLARRLTDHGVPTSQPYISRLLNGHQSNPSAALVGALSHALKVPVTYWYDEAVAEEILDQLR